MERTSTNLTTEYRKGVSEALEAFQPFTPRGWTYVFLSRPHGEVSIAVGTNGFGDIDRLAEALSPFATRPVYHKENPPHGQLAIATAAGLSSGDIFVLRATLDPTRLWRARVSVNQRLVTVRAFETADESAPDKLPASLRDIEEIDGVETATIRGLAVHFTVSSGFNPSTTAWRVAGKAGFHLDHIETLAQFEEGASFWNTEVR